jgi:glucose-6-phosphate isomerase
MMNLQIFPKKDLVSTMAHLDHLKNSIGQKHLIELFDENKERFEQYSIEYNELIFDYSKHRVNQSVLSGLLDVTKARDLPTWIKRLFSQEELNYTEQRAAMHWALRLPKNHEVHPQLAQQVHQQLERMYELVDKIHAGQCRGATGEVIQDVVNIGVGGSDLGPMMVSHALSDFKVKTVKPLNVHFVSTMDGTQLSDILHKLRPETTLFIISSKSFGTVDTLYNAQTARQWLYCFDLKVRKRMADHHWA